MLHFKLELRDELRAKASQLEAFVGPLPSKPGARVASLLRPTLHIPADRLRQTCLNRGRAQPEFTLNAPGVNDEGQDRTTFELAGKANLNLEEGAPSG